MRGVVLDLRGFEIAIEGVGVVCMDHCAQGLRQIVPVLLVRVSTVSNNVPN